jgi:hypothetical protein
VPIEHFNAITQNEMICTCKILTFSPLYHRNLSTKNGSHFLRLYPISQGKTTLFQRKRAVVRHEAMSKIFGIFFRTVSNFINKFFR